MRKDGYIKKVLSHIEGKQHRKIVEAELCDHILSNEEHLAEIGYDKQTAELKAEEEMGDADVAGEQFNAYSIERRTMGTVLAVFAALTCFACALLFITTYEEDTVNFIMFCSAWVLFVFNLILLGLSINKRALTGAVFSTLGAGIVCFFVPWYIAYLPLLYLKKVDVAQGFYSYGTAYQAFIEPESTGYIAAMLILEAILLIIGVLCVVTITRIKKLKNNLWDLKLIKGCSIAVFLIVFLSVSVFTAITVTTKQAQDRMVNEARSAVSFFDGVVFENAEAFYSDDCDAFSEKLKKAVEGKSGIIINDRGSNDLCLDITLGKISLDYYYYEGEATLEISSDLYDLNGDEVELFRKDELLGAREYEGDFKGVPKPCLLMLKKYSENEFKPEAKAFYTSVYLFDTFNAIIYEYKDGKFEYQKHDFSIKLTGEDAEFNEQQKALFHQLLIDEYCQNELYDKFFDYDKEVFENIFGVSYNSELDEYQVDLYFYTEMSAIVDGKLFTLSPNYCEIASISVKFENGKAVQTGFWTPEDGSYYPKSIKARFSKKAYQKWQNSDTSYMYSSSIAQRVAARRKMPVYGDLASIDEDGNFTYFKYTENYSNFADEEETIKL